MSRLTLYRPHTGDYDEALELLDKSDFDYDEGLEPENPPLTGEGQPVLGVYIPSIDDEYTHSGIETIEQVLETLNFDTEDDTRQKLKS